MKTRSRMAARCSRMVSGASALRSSCADESPPIYMIEDNRCRPRRVREGIRDLAS